MLGVGGQRQGWGERFSTRVVAFFCQVCIKHFVMSRVLVAQIHAIAGGLNSSISLWSAAEPHYRVLILRTALTMSRHVIITGVITTTNCHYIISNNYSLVI